MANTQGTGQGAQRTGDTNAAAGQAGQSNAKENPTRSGNQGSPQTQNIRPESQGMSGQAGGQGMNQNASKVRERMTVVASCGTRVGVVDHVEGNAIKLTKHDSKDGQHHFIPMDWVERVDNEVHLRKNSKETEQGWKSDASSCHSGTCGM